MIAPHRLLKRSLIAMASCCLAALFVIPYFYLIFSSVKHPFDIVTAPPTFFPKAFTWENYRTMMSGTSIVGYAGNSLAAMSASTVLCVSMGAMAAFGLSRLRSKLGTVLLVITLCLKMIPLSCISVPIYGMIKSLRLYDSVLGLIAVYTSINLPFVIWMMYSFFDGIPRDLDEAALMDGCNKLRTFTRVIFPISRPGFTTTGIFTAMSVWNDFLFGFLLTSTRAKTVPVAISEYLTTYSVDMGPMISMAVLFSIPIIVLSISGQRYIISGMTLGSVKG